MVICILTSSYPRFPGDYAGVFVAELARELAKRGIEVIVLAPRAPGLEAYEVSEGVRLYRFSYFWPRRWELLAYGHGIPSNLRRYPLLYFLLPFFLVGQIQALKRLVREEKIHLINAHWIVVQGLAAAWLQRSKKVPFVLTIHGAGLHALMRFPLGRAVADRIVRSADHIFCVSSALGLLLNHFLGREIPVEILPMGIDLGRFNLSQWPQGVARKKFDIGEGKAILFLGRLEQVKGVRVLIEAVQTLADLHERRLSLYIAGDGLERSALEGLVVRCRLQERVRFLGAVPHDQVPSLLAAADVVCVPSLVEESGVTEGLGMVVIEAMAMGKVVVASRVGGIPDLIQDGINGFLAAPGDAQAWTARLAEVMSLGDKVHPIGQAARQTAERFSWKIVADKYVAVLRAFQDSA